MHTDSGFGICNVQMRWIQPTPQNFGNPPDSPQYIVDKLDSATLLSIGTLSIQGMSSSSRFDWTTLQRVSWSVPVGPTCVKTESPEGGTRSARTPTQLWNGNGVSNTRRRSTGAHQLKREDLEALGQRAGERIGIMLQGPRGGEERIDHVSPESSDTRSTPRRHSVKNVKKLGTPFAVIYVYTIYYCKWGT